MSLLRSPSQVGTRGSVSEGSGYARRIVDAAPDVQENCVKNKQTKEQLSRWQERTAAVRQRLL